MKPTAAPSADAALALIKPEVRAQMAYTLEAPPAPRKLNQNESPFDAPEVVKEAVIRAAWGEPWNRYPPFTPWRATGGGRQRLERADPGDARRDGGRGD